MAAMEAGDEAEVGAPSASISATTEQSLTVLVASSLGLGYLCFLLHGQAPKPLSAAIGAAHGALKGAKVLGNIRFPPSPSSFLAASQVLIKGYNATKRLNLIRMANTTEGSSSFISKRVAAYLRALNVIRYARAFLLGDGVVGLGLLSSGYKLSKNFLKVVEDFTGNRFDSALKNVVDAVGLSVKAAIVVSELERIAVARRRGTNCCCGFPRSCPSSSSCVLHPKVEKTTIDCGFESWKRFPVEQLATYDQIVSISQQPPLTSPSELLCLSIPLTGHIAY